MFKQIARLNEPTHLLVVVVLVVVAATAAAVILMLINYKSLFAGLHKCQPIGQAQ